jgi:hypothetical protein
MTNLRGEAAKALSSRKGAKTIRHMCFVYDSIQLIKMSGGGVRESKCVCVAVEQVYSVSMTVL